MLNLTPSETERLLLFSAAELARRRRSRRIRLSQAEAEALLADEALELARSGLSLVDVIDQVGQLLTTDDVADGVAHLVDAIIVEGQFRDGTRLIVVYDPIKPGATPLGDPPGEVVTGDGDLELNAGRATVTIDVLNRGDRAIHVTSHHHFAEVNRALRFDRRAAVGFHLDIAAGTTVRFEPGLTTTVALVALGGHRRLAGHQGIVQGPITEAMADRIVEWADGSSP